MDAQLKVKADGSVKRDRLADLICCALEGGSTYWCESFRPDHYPEGCEWGHEAVAHGASFKIAFDDGNGRAEMEVENSDEKLGQTLELMARDYASHFANFMNENEDADTGDCFFQLLCFGEVVYG